jgi:hypothetical protein
MILRLGLLAVVLLVAAPATAQIYTPQSAAALSVSVQSERMGGSRVLCFGEVRNSGSQGYDRVVVLVEGLDEAGHVVTKGRAYVGSVPARGRVSFEARILSGGSDKRYRASVEAWEISGGTQSP